jgi:hypothetical protein
LDIRIVEPAVANGHSYAAIVERVNDLGPASKIRVRLTDGQPLVAEVPNDDLPVLSAGDRVLLDLRNVKVFEGEADLVQGSMSAASTDDGVPEGV